MKHFIITIFFANLLLTAFAQNDVIVQAPDTQVDAGEQTTYPITINPNGNNVATLTFEIEYDSTLFEVLSLEYPPGWFTLGNINTPGTILIAGFNINGQTTTFQAVSIIFNTIGQAGQTDIQLNIEGITDNNGQALNYQSSDGSISIGSGGCTSRTADAKLAAIGGEFGQFANEEFIKNFLTAEKGYIRYQAEIHRILESKDERYTQVNQNFEKIKGMAMAMLFQSFVSKRPVTMTDQHIKAIDNFLISLSQATSKGKLRNEITKVRQHLHVMESKEVKDALIAFDRAGALDTSDITPFDTPDQDEFDVQLLNIAGRESRVSYNIVKQGILNMSLYNTHGQQVRTLHNGINYEGHHQIPIDKNGLPPGIYFIHIEYIAGGVPINKILKLPVMK